MRKAKIIGMLALACGLTFGAAGYTAIQANAATDVAAPTITSAMQGDTIVLLNGDVADFALNYTKNSAINYAPTDGIATDRYVPKAATISWENTRDDALYYTLKVGLEEDLSDANSYLVSETSADIDYLYVAKHYYYQVYAHYDNDEVVKSRVFDFYTADTPRTVYIEGVTNTRDIGGRYVMDGQYQIKQGMVYRGAEVDRELGSITEEGRRVMLYDLGIKTDLDIRGGDVQNAKGTSPIDDSLNYVHLEAPWYSHVFNSSYRDAFATEIRTFANPDNYPIYFHCSVGRDRAGTLSMLLGALLGVEEADLYRDYEMSFFSRIGLKDAAQSEGDYNNLIRSFTDTITRIKTDYPAATFMESVEAWMKSYLGITQEEIDAIRNNLLEETDGTRVDNSAVKKSVSRVKDNKAKVATTDSDFPCTYSANPDKLYSGYGSSTVTAYTAEEAAAAGIPAGYEGTVLSVVPISGNLCGVILDFTAKNIPLGLIDSLQFRVYIGEGAGTGNYPQIRIPRPDGTGNWVYQVNQAVAMGQWITVTVPYSSSFEYISANGNLGAFELSLRANAKVPFYVDSAKVIFKDDGKAPVINYTGADAIAVQLGDALDLPVTVTDTQETGLQVQYIWEDGVALNENGTPKQVGTYALTLKVVDFFGHTATKTISVTVIESDGEAPVIGMNLNEVKAMAGAKPMFAVNATDNSGLVTVTKTWSNGALDKRGNLTVGEHTWTIVAEDVSGNKTTKTVRFIVTENEPAYAYVVDEGSAFGTFTVTFDGENAISVPYGLKLTKPADPVRETTAEARYTFLGWYVGDKEWNFDQDVVTSDLDIQSKWEVTKRSYKVSFDGAVVPKNVEYGELIPTEYIPEDPQKSPSITKEYTFDGWYLGNKKWNFETDVVTGVTELVAKYTETTRLYTVTFDGENAQQYTFSSKIAEPETPVKAPTATHTYEFIGWYNGTQKWNFETGFVTGNIDLVSKWKEVAIEGAEPSDPTEPEEPTTSETPDVPETPDNSVNEGDGSDTAQPGVSGVLAGCSGVIGGVASGMVALGVAACVFLRKKED
ncbi:MAG: tyrosine-protein phosphatase [Clostridia bacterium]|nr:tyrosine-protein phosphatase [Clostridia bacterium]